MSTDQRADVAVIIPTIGSSNKLLERALNSVEQQTLLPREVLVVVDVPSRHQEITRRLLPFDNRMAGLRILLTKGAQGPSYARNLAANLATSSYLAFLDDDDEFFPTKIARVSEYCGKADVIYHGLQWNVEGMNIKFTQRPGAARLPEILIENTIGPPSAVVVRRSTYHRLGGFREDLPALEDYEFWVRLTTSGVTAVAIDAVLSKYSVRLKGGSRSSNSSNDRLAWQRVHSLYSEYYAALRFWHRAKHRQYIYSGRMHRYRGAGRRWQAAGWAILAAFAYPSGRSLTLATNALTLPFLAFGARGLQKQLAVFIMKVSGWVVSSRNNRHSH